MNRLAVQLQVFCIVDILINRATNPVKKNGLIVFIYQHKNKKKVFDVEILFV